MGRMRVNFLGRIENFSFEEEAGVQEDGFVMEQDMWKEVGREERRRPVRMEGRKEAVSPV